MGAWQIPAGVEKDIDVKKISPSYLIYLHDQLHVIWDRIKEGYQFDWSFREAKLLHEKVLKEFRKRDIKHYSPVNDLDRVKFENYAKINYSGNEQGEEIKLNEVLDNIDDFKIKEPYVYLVGGLVNHGKTKGDIDILIKKNAPKDENEDIPLKFRIMRMLPQKLWHRLHFLYDDQMHGPFTNYVPLFSLMCKVNSRQVHKMSEKSVRLRLSKEEDADKSEKENSIKPFRFFIQPKPTHGRETDEIYSLESIEDTIKKLDWKFPVIAEPKYDGVRCQVHKVKDRVEIWSEEGEDYTKQLPTLVKQFKSINHDFICGFEAELWKDGKHANRADTAGILNSDEVEEEEKNMMATIYDCVWFDGKDIHEYPYKKRFDFAQKITGSGNIRITKQETANSIQELKKYAKRFINQKGSEGAMFKLPDYKYTLDGDTDSMIKFKNEVKVTAQVLAKHKVEGTKDTFYYTCGIQDKTYIGKTFNTSVDVDVGDKLEVVFVDLNQYTDPESNEVWFNWWSPRVVGKGSGNILSISKAKEIVEQTSGSKEKKEAPKIENSEELQEMLIQNPKSYNPEEVEDRVLLDDHRILHAWMTSLKKGKVLKSETGANITKQLVKVLHDKVVREMKKRDMEHNSPMELEQLQKDDRKFVVQHHIRGGSEHIDFRYEREDDMLAGFTLAAQEDDPSLDDALDEYWNLEKGDEEITLKWKDQIFYKFDKSSEKVTQEPPENLKDKVYNKVEELVKKDKFWKINLQQGKPKKREGQEGKEQVEKIWSEQKNPEPHEWLNTEGITAPRQVEPEPGGTRFYPGIFINIDKGTLDLGAQKSYFKEYFLRGEKWRGRYLFRQVSQEKEGLTWYFWKPESQEPYVLSKRAIDKEWLPEEGSALPADMERKVPHNLAYWKGDLSKQERLKLRKKLRDQFETELKKLDSGEKLALSEQEENEEKFLLTTRWWKGQEVVRKTRVEDWHIKVAGMRFHLDDNPVNTDTVTAAEFEKEGDFFKPGDYKPDSYVNPNKEIDVHVEKVDSGSVKIIKKDPKVLHVKFSGDKLEGIYVFHRTSKDSKIWTLEKSDAPSSNSRLSRSGDEVNDEEKRTMCFLNDSGVGISEIAHYLGRPNRTIYNWLNKLRQRKF